MKRFFSMLCGVVMLGAALSVCTFAGRCVGVRENVVRLHILANSDSEADQALKLNVRDAVTAASAGLLDGVTTRAEAEERLRAALPQLIETAQAAVYAGGYTYPVKAELTTMAFTTRVYDGATFPAGQYHTVRFTIGEGAGRNWWCVMYPPLCVSAATDKDSLQKVMPSGACEIVTASSRFTVRFKVVEWFEQIAEWFSKAGG